MKRSFISGIGHHVPSRVIRSEKIEKKLGLNKGLIESITGVRERRYAKKGILPSEMCTIASKKALERAGLNPLDIDVIIFSGVSYDVTEPATANIIQERLGAKNAWAFDMKNACVAFLNALFVGDLMIKMGKAKNVLITAGEVISPFIDLKVKNEEDLKYKFAGLTLGDGAGAVVLSETREKKKGILESDAFSIGKYWDLAVVWAGGSMHPRRPDLEYFYSDSMKINMVAYRTIPDLIKKVIKKTGWKPGDVDMVFPHQVSISITRKILGKVGIPPEKQYITVHKFGNTASASIPIALGDACEKGLIKEGMKAVFAAGASGFAAMAMTVIF